MTAASEFTAITSAEELRGLLGAPMRRPALALIVEIEQIFFHCAKALMRSKLWRPETWEPDALPSHARIVKDVQPAAESVEELERYYSEAEYAKKLYKA